ncbi:MAG TPA: MarR family transcriptional regulator [Pseudogracilibacillus sp.]|nr:MarR family transcriptional regulator [Pseudogracilibacillus sp.]
MIKQHVHTDITTDQFTILQFIYQREKVTATEISQHLGLGKSAITAYVNRLMQKDLLQRKRNEQDRRIVYLSLTNYGMKVVKITEKEIHQFIEEKLAHFDSKEVEKFLHALERLSDLMEMDQRLEE